MESFTQGDQEQCDTVLEMKVKEERMSSSGDTLMLPKSSPAPTPASSSVGASSAAVPINAGSINWLGHGKGSKEDSVSHIGSQPFGASFSTSACGSALGSSWPSCRPWERNDLLRRLSTFKSSNWFAKPKAASNVACARRGWFNIEVDKIKCESCGANLKFIAPATGESTEAESSAEDFAKLLDGGHRTNCPWRGNSCAESLVQFLPIPPSALIGGYKDRCDALLQFISLPIVAGSAIEQMRVSRTPEIERFLVNLQDSTVKESALKTDILPHMEETREEFVCSYSCAQKLISLCGWEPKWLPDVQDFEEHSAQSARNGQSGGPTKDPSYIHDGRSSKSAFSASNRKNTRKNEVMGLNSTCESRSPLLDCSLCGTTIRVLDFLTIARPAHIAPGNVDIPETSKKLALSHGVSGISGWVVTNGMEKEQNEGDEATTMDEGAGMDLNLAMGGGLSIAQLQTTTTCEQHQGVSLGGDLIIGQPSNSEGGDPAQSYESRGPTTHKRNLEDGRSTVDRTHLLIRQADSIEDPVIDRDGDEVNDGYQFCDGPSKRARDSYAFETCHPSYKRDSSDADPSKSLVFENKKDLKRDYPSRMRADQYMGALSTKDSTRASSVIAMDTLYHSADNDSMESVENRPGDIDEVNLSSMLSFRNPDLNDTSEVNYRNQAEQSVCPAPVTDNGEIGDLSKNECEEILNTDTTVAGARDVPSIELCGGNFGIEASHEAEIHGNDLAVRKAANVVGDIELVAEVTENQGQTGEFTPYPGQADFVPHGMGPQHSHGDSQSLVSRSVGRADSDSKIVGSAKGDSVDSGEKTMHLLPHENSNHPSLSCNANIYSGNEASKEEVTQADKGSPTGECGYQGPEYIARNGVGPPDYESNYEEAVEFDPIKHHNYFCPWVNGNVAAAGFSSSGGFNSSASDVAICGWQLTLDALDEFQTLAQVPNQNSESASAASLYKDDHLTNGPKLAACNSFSKSQGPN